jgi:hypothetical protein
VVGSLARGHIRYAHRGVTSPGTFEHPLPRSHLLAAPSPSHRSALTSAWTRRLEGRGDASLGIGASRPGASIVVAVTSASAHEFFLGSASVAGALIGLLFVAVSVASERVLGPEASEVHGVRAAATLAAFTNALTVSLFGLVPGFNVGGAATVVAIVGLLFIGGAAIRLVPAWNAKRIHLRDLTFLVALLVVFVIQLIAGVKLARRASDTSDLQTICVLVIVCFLIGIARAWELVGGPNIYLIHQLLERRQTRRRPDEGSDGVGDQ